jgi:hypothetical protein
MRRPDPMLVVVIALVVACVAAALLLGRSAWAAACGSCVVVAMWAIEKLAARRGSEGSFGYGVAVGLGGMLARVALAATVLVAIGVAASKEAFIDATLAFVASYTVYNVARLWRHPAVAAGRAEPATTDRMRQDHVSGQD